MLVKLPNHEGRRTWNLHRTWFPRYLKLCSCRSEHCSSMCWIAMIPCAWRQGSLGHRGESVVELWKVRNGEVWKSLCYFFAGSGTLSRLWGTWIITNHMMLNFESSRNYQWSKLALDFDSGNSQKTQSRLEQHIANNKYTKNHVFKFVHQSFDRRLLRWDTWQAPFGDSRSGTESSVGSAIHAGTQCLRTCRVLEVAFCCNQSCHGDLPLDDQHVLTDGCYAVFECFWCTFIDARPLHV